MTALAITAALIGALATYNRGAGFPWSVPSLPRWAKLVLTIAAAGALAWSTGAVWWAVIACAAATGAAWALGHGAGLPLVRREWGLRAFLVMLGTGIALTLPMALCAALAGLYGAAVVALVAGALKPACYWWSGRSDDRANAYHAATAWGGMLVGITYQL